MSPFDTSHLAGLKGDEDLSSIPVAVLTASRDPHVEQRCYSLHVNAYNRKPADHDDLASVIDQIITWFLGLIAIPDSS